VLDFIVEQARSKKRTAREPAIAAATESRLLLVCEAIHRNARDSRRLDVLAAIFAIWMKPQVRGRSLRGGRSPTLQAAAVPLPSERMRGHVRRRWLRLGPTWRQTGAAGSAPEPGGLVF